MLYRIFKIVADEGNLTKASEILFISQPAVTKHIHNLENELNLIISLGTLHENFFVNSNSEYLNKSISIEDAVTIYTLRKISSTSKNIEAAIKESDFNNIVIKNNTLSTILEELQGNDIIAYITEEYIQKELSEGKLKKIDLGIELSNEIEYGIYYNANNKLKNVKKIFENIKLNTIT